MEGNMTALDFWDAQLGGGSSLDVSMDTTFVPTGWEAAIAGDMTALDFWDAVLGSSFDVYKDNIRYAVQLGRKDTAQEIVRHVLLKIISQHDVDIETALKPWMKSPRTMTLVYEEVLPKLAAGQNCTEYAALLRLALRNTIHGIQDTHRASFQALEPWVRTPNAAAAIYDDALALAAHLNKVETHGALLRLILRRIIEDEEEQPSALEHWVNTPKPLNAATAAVYDEALALAVHLNKTDMVKDLLPHTYANTLAWRKVNTMTNAETPFSLEERIRIRQYDNPDDFIEFHRVIGKAYLHNNIKMMELLLQAGAYLDAWLTVDIVDFGEGPLVFIAAIQGKKDIVELLINYGANVEDHKSYFTPLYAAVELNRYDVAEMLLNFGADSNILGDCNVGPRPDLMGGRAILKGTVKMVKLLLRHDMDINLLGCWNGTFLDAALQRTIEEPAVGRKMVELVLERNVDFDIQDAEILKFGDTWHDYTESSARQTVNLEQLPPDVRTMVERARYIQSLEYLKSLKDNDLNVQDRFGRTALHRAAENGQLEQVKYLLTRRASPVIRDDMGRRPHELAKHRWDIFNEKRDCTDMFGVFDQFYDDKVIEIMESKDMALAIISDLLQDAVDDALPEHYKYAMIAHAYRTSARQDRPIQQRYKLRQRHAGKCLLGLAKIVLNLPQDMVGHIMTMGIGYKPYKLEKC